MPIFKKFLLPLFLFTNILLFSVPVRQISAKAGNTIAFVILSDYKATVDIGDEFYIAAFTSDGKLPAWKSSRSSVVSVNTYGKVTAKKAGSAVITAKIKGAEASCSVTVRKTVVTISCENASIERGESLRLSAASSGSPDITWKSSRPTVAEVDDNGTVTGLKPGEATITASADNVRATCKVTVRRPEVKLSQTRLTLYRNQKARLSATVSSGVKPSWKTNKKSVAVVDHEGTVVAVKHGTAIITATVDGVSKTCEVVVKQPVMTLKPEELTIKKGETEALSVYVSSNNTPVWSTSNPNVAKVNSKGQVTGLKKGRAYIYASEDGIKLKCTVYVTE